MKKIIIGFGALMLTAGAVVYAYSATQNSASCCQNVNSIECPCTPDCQPGDAWCTCPEDCKD